MIGFGTGARASFLFLPLSSCLFAHVGDLGAEARGEAHREAHHNLGEQQQTREKAAVFGLDEKIGTCIRSGGAGW
jgi:hypothetical protein